MNRFTITGGDGGAYGPVIGPLSGTEIREIRNYEGMAYLLVALDTPTDLGGARTEHLLLSQRYRGMTLDAIRERPCTVNILRVLPDAIEALSDTDAFPSSIEFITVGKTEPEDITKAA